MYCNAITPADYECTDITAFEIFSILSFVFQFVAPSVVISFCYFYVSRLLRIRRQQKLGSRFRSAQKQDLEARRHNKTNRCPHSLLMHYRFLYIFALTSNKNTPIIIAANSNSSFINGLDCLFANIYLKCIAIKLREYPNKLQHIQSIYDLRMHGEMLFGPIKNTMDDREIDAI
ncbi:hypothetical protein TSMEX_000300 [Taenia solium]|eukprot:TsM_000439600 transcript=TsM_000439600 gene=TsM_000439600